MGLNFSGVMEFSSLGIRVMKVELRDGRNQRKALDSSTTC